MKNVEIFEKKLGIVSVWAILTLITGASKEAPKNDFRLGSLYLLLGSVSEKEKTKTLIKSSSAVNVIISANAFKLDLRV